MADDARTRMLLAAGSTVWIFVPGHFSGLRTYLTDLGPFLTGQLAKERAAWEAENGPNESAIVVGDYTDVVPGVLYSSFIVALMIEAEQCVRVACDDLSVVVAPNKTLGDFEGSPFQRARTFLTKYGDQKKPTQHRWTDVQTIWEIRNAIVHNQGTPKAASRKRIDRLFKRLKLPSNSKLAENLGLYWGPPINLRVCELCLNIIEEFVTELHDANRDLFFKIREAEGIKVLYDDDDG